MSATVKIALAEDEPLFRKGIASILEQQKEMEVVFEADNGAELLTFLEKGGNHPDIVLTDLKMPEVNGVEATRTISELYPHIKTIVLTNYKTRSLIVNMIHIGSASYLLKNTTARKMIATIKKVSEKGYFYDDEVLNIIKENSATLKKQRKFSFDSEELTQREKEIIKLICKQYSTKEIADKLFISNRTVDGHRNNLLLKTDSKNMAGLVVYAMLNNIITAEDLIF